MEFECAREKCKDVKPLWYGNDHQLKNNYLKFGSFN